MGRFNLYAVSAIIVCARLCSDCACPRPISTLHRGYLFIYLFLFIYYIIIVLNLIFFGVQKWPLLDRSIIHPDGDNFKRPHKSFSYNIEKLLRSCPRFSDPYDGPMDHMYIYCVHNKSVAD